MDNTYGATEFIEIRIKNGDYKTSYLFMLHMDVVDLDGEVTTEVSQAKVKTEIFN